MRSAWRVLVIAGGMALTGAIANRVVAPAWSALRAREPALRLDSKTSAAGHGVVLALLGGFSALVADGLWVRMYWLWEHRELAAVDTLVHAVPAIDPRPVYFWLNGARILAYDLASWRVVAEGGYDSVPATEIQRIDHEQAAFAIAHLESARRYHPKSPDLWIEQAAIELNRRRDLSAAAECYRKAWEQPDAPYYAARLHAEMLRRLGRKAEALAFLKKLYPQLPPGDEAAAAPLVLVRIRELEHELGIPDEQRIQAGKGP
jgi:tetratricopeptide (TPR) repeat protein